MPASIAETTQTIRCQKCPNRYTGSRPDLHMSASAQARALGWTGKTIGGREETRRFCPACSGRTEPPETDERGWDALCETCDASASEDWADEAPLSEDDVATWKFDHQCEPNVRLIRPLEAS